MAKRGKKGGPKFYAVAVGRIPGIYYTWPECQAQTSGYSGAIFKSFEIMQEAQTFLRQNGASSSNSASSSLPASIDRVALNTTMMANETTNRGTKRPHPDALGTAPLHHAHQPLLPTTVTTTTTTTSKQNSNHRIRIIIHFDGGSRGNPGVAGAGAQVIVMEEGQSIKHETTTATSNNLDIDNNTKEYHIRKYCGEHATNNYAEYSGLLSGLEVAKSYIDNVCKHASEDKSELPSINLAVYGDSNLVIQQMRGVWKCTHTNIRPLFNQCNTIIFEMKECAAAATGRECRQLSGKSSSIVITYEHVRRNLNGVADALANEAMDTRKSWTSIITTGTTSIQAIDAGKNRDAIKPVLQSTSVVGALSSKQKVIDVDEKSNDSDGNESYYSC